MIDLILNDEFFFVSPMNVTFGGDMPSVRSMHIYIQILGDKALAKRMFYLEDVHRVKVDTLSI